MLAYRAERPWDELDFDHGVPHDDVVGEHAHVIAMPQGWPELDHGNPPTSVGMEGAAWFAVHDHA